MTSMTIDIATFKVQFLSRRLLLDLHTNCLRLQQVEAFKITSRYQSAVSKSSTFSFPSLFCFLLFRFHVNNFASLSSSFLVVFKFTYLKETKRKYFDWLIVQLIDELSPTFPLAGSCRRMGMYEDSGEWNWWALFGIGALINLSHFASSVSLKSDKSAAKAHQIHIRRFTMNYWLNQQQPLDVIVDNCSDLIISPEYLNCATCHLLLSLTRNFHSIRQLWKFHKTRYSRSAVTNWKYRISIPLQLAMAQ